MYQSIDDPLDEATLRESVRKPVLIWLVVILGLAAIFALVYFYSPRQADVPQVNKVLLAEQATYRKAVAETAAPMRRARLQDFLTTYPESGYTPVIEAQLDVINAREEQSWRGVSEVIFAGKLSRDEKLAALESFEQKWGASLLGGRGDEITRVRAEIMQTIETPSLPDRKLKQGPSPIPKNVPDTELVGGPGQTTPLQPTIIEPSEPIDEPLKVVELDIVPPRIRRNVTPRYPRKAMRRKVEAIVTLKLNINAKGKVAMTELVDIEADRYQKDFIKAAERAALRTRFHPKTIGGKPTEAVGVVKRYRFQISN